MIREVFHIHSKVILLSEETSPRAVMQVLRWRTQTLVDSTVASTAQLSSSAVLLRESLYGTKRSSQQRQGRNERGNFRPDFERERRSRRDERDNIFLNFDRIQRSNRGVCHILPSLYDI